MRVLLDHCVDRRVAGLLRGHEVQTAADMGWHAIQNGELLAAAAAGGFEVLVTTDKNLRYQHNLAKLAVAVIELNAPDSRLFVLRQMLLHFDAACGLLSECRFVAVHVDGRLERVGSAGRMGGRP